MTHANAILAAIAVAGLSGGGLQWTLADVERHTVDAQTAEVRRWLETSARQNAVTVDAASHALLQGADRHGDALHSTMESALRAQLDADPAVTFLYTVTLDGFGMPRFVLDPQDDPGLAVNLWDVYTDPPREVLAALRSGQVLSTPGTYRDQWGCWLSAYAPLRKVAGRQVGIIAVTISCDELDKRLRPTRDAFGHARGMAWLITAAVGAAVFAGAAVQSGVTRRVGELADTMGRKC